MRELVKIQEDCVEWGDKVLLSPPYQRLLAEIEFYLQLELLDDIQSLDTLTKYHKRYL